MTPTTPTLRLTGYLGRDTELCLTTPRDFSHTVHDPITDGDITIEGTTPIREYAKLSLAVRAERDRSTTWYTLRAWDLDHHPDEARIRSARKGQRVTVEGHWEIHRYTDRNNEPREFKYLRVTSFRFRPGRLLRPQLSAGATA